MKIPYYARGARIDIEGLLNELVSVLGPDPTVGLQINTGFFTEATLEDQLLCTLMCRVKILNNSRTYKKVFYSPRPKIRHKNEKE